MVRPDSVAEVPPIAPGELPVSAWRFYLYFQFFAARPDFHDAVERLAHRALEYATEDEFGAWASEHHPHTDLGSDMAAGVEFLWSRPEIQRNRIGLAGVSQAGSVVPIAVARAQPRSCCCSSGPRYPSASNTSTAASSRPMHPVEEVSAVTFIQEFQRM